MTHAHHYLIATPELGVRLLAAVCKHCGFERTFPAVPDELGYNGKPARHQQPKVSPRVFGAIWEA